MLISLLSMMVMAQGAEARSADALSTPPIQIRKTPECTCSDEIDDSALILQGLVVDAELRLGADGRSPDERQATIFDVKPANSLDIKGRTRIWHSTNSQQCGLTFDYGLQYSLAVRRTEDGAFETDACLMRSAQKAE